MPLTAKNITQHELIDLKVTVVESNDKSHIGVEGKVVDESRNMLFIENIDVAKIWKIPKGGAVFEFTIGSERIRVKGDDISFRPEDRIKRNR